VFGYVALGSNLGDRESHLALGLRRLADRGLAATAVSSVWETEPVDSPSPAWFLNMAVEVHTELTPFDVLAVLQAVEREAGRVRDVRNGPRTLDLDLLLLGRLEVDDARLRLPHPRMWQRAFVLAPLAEIAPDLVNPRTGRTVVEERDALDGDSRIRRLGALASH
jgi:2-amino-4-hydroxy-6-hydroxymethyldihydropteridine diphosphokinase